jgi:hypothetical protein
MGMPLYGAVPPTGYKWESSTWVSTGALVNRMNFALTLAANKLPGITVSVTPQTALPDTDYGAVPPSEGSGPPGAAHNAVSSKGPPALPAPAAEEQRIETLLVAGGVSETTRSAVLQQLEAQVTQTAPSGTPVPVIAKPQNPKQAAAALEKQDQLLAGLLLGSPEFQRR